MEDLGNKLENLKISISEKAQKEEKKIYIIFSGSGLLWCKTKKLVESDIKPDFIFQKNKFIYYNKKFLL